MQSVTRHRASGSLFHPFTWIAASVAVTQLTWHATAASPRCSPHASPSAPSPSPEGRRWDVQTPSGPCGRSQPSAAQPCVPRGRHNRSARPSPLAMDPDGEGRI